MINDDLLAVRAICTSARDQQRTDSIGTQRCQRQQLKLKACVERTKRVVLLDEFVISQPKGKRSLANTIYADYILRHP